MNAEERSLERTWNSPEAGASVRVSPVAHAVGDLYLDGEPEVTRPLLESALHHCREQGFLKLVLRSAPEPWAMEVVETGGFRPAGPRPCGSVAFYRDLYRPERSPRCKGCKFAFGPDAERSEQLCSQA